MTALFSEQKGEFSRPEESLHKKIGKNLSLPIR